MIDRVCWLNEFESNSQRRNGQGPREHGYNEKARVDGCWIVLNDATLPCLTDGVTDVNLAVWIVWHETKTEEYGIFCQDFNSSFNENIQNENKKFKCHLMLPEVKTIFLINNFDI